MAFIPLPQDNHEPTNDWLWEQCLKLVRGERHDLRYQDKVIQGPNDGHGWKHWPAPKGVAWAVKQYNNLGGGWRNKKTGASIKFAGLGDTLEQLMTSLISHWDPAKAKHVGQWYEQNFRVSSPKTPRGMKALKEKAESLRWWLMAGPSSYATTPEVAAKEVSRLWTEIRPQLEDLVAGFTDEGSVVVPKELKLGGNTYINDVGVNEAALKKYAARLETIFDALKGWHKKALVGGVEVVLASPRHFRGTAGGVYKISEGGKLYVRATPAVLSRSGGYGDFEYILVHELGHRYEHKNRLPSEDFDKPTWWTSKYSMKEGESFAELFALSHFNLHGSWDPSKVERFQALMSGQGDTAKPELPEHLRRFI